MNIEKYTEIYFTVEVVKEKNGNSCYNTISIEREDLAKVIAKALKADGFEVHLTRITHKKTDQHSWKTVKV